MLEGASTGESYGDSSAAGVYASRGHQLPVHLVTSENLAWDEFSYTPLTRQAHSVDQDWQTCPYASLAWRGNHDDPHNMDIYGDSNQT